jgi:hypothetical protein
MQIASCNGPQKRFLPQFSVSGEIFEQMGQNPSVPKTKRIHVVIFQFPFIKLKYVP